MITAIALFCDDIREEKLGTVSVVGIYPDNINVPKVPFIFPKLGIYARMSFAINDEPKTVALRLVHPDGSETQLTELDPAIIGKAHDEAQTKGAARAGLISRTLMVPFPVSQEGRINVIVKADGEDVVCGTLNIEISRA